MTDATHPSIDTRDFDAIEAAVMETARGRWFLAEFARRNKTAETRLLLEAIGRLEQNVAAPPPEAASESWRGEIMAIRATLARAAAEIAADDEEGGRTGDLASGLERVASSATRLEAASADMHDAAERIGEIAWRLRESGVDARLCGELERRAAAISTASAFQDLTARRARIVADALRAVERCLDARSPDQSAAAVSASPTQSVPPVVVPEHLHPPAEKAAAIDRASLQRSPSRPHILKPEPRRAELRDHMPALDLAALDELDIRARLRLFT